MHLFLVANVVSTNVRSYDRKKSGPVQLACLPLLLRIWNFEAHLVQSWQTALEWGMPLANLQGAPLLPKTEQVWLQEATRHAMQGFLRPTDCVTDKSWKSGNTIRRCRTCSKDLLRSGQLAGFRHAAESRRHASNGSTLPAWLAFPTLLLCYLTLGFQENTIWPSIHRI